MQASVMIAAYFGNGKIGSLIGCLIEDAFILLCLCGGPCYMWFTSLTHNKDLNMEAEQKTIHVDI